MSKKKQSYSNAGKGDKSHVSNKKKYDANWDKIFKNKIRTEPVYEYCIRKY